MSGEIRIDVVVPTYNRSGLLRLTLDSLLKAKIPPGLNVTVVVVDNNSKDDTAGLVSAYLDSSPVRVKYIFEPHQGRSHALNAGIAASTAELVGMVDDDEQVDEGWFETVHRWFTADHLDFIGGPYKPNWETQPPKWLPSDCPAVIGIIDAVREVRTFGHDYNGMLMGGNAVIRRSILEQVGPYSTLLGRTDKKLLTGEDEDMYERLIAAGARGKYIPDLIIYHHIPASRLTKSYYRSWFFWRGVSKFVKNCQRREPVPHAFGVPRYLYGRAVRFTAHAAKNAVFGRLRSAETLSAELRWWDLAGWLWGRCLQSGGRLEKL